MSNLTAQFADYVRDKWYYYGCDVTSEAPGKVVIGLPPEFPISAFCAGISNEPFNATADLLHRPGDSKTSQLLCTLNALPAQQPQPPQPTGTWWWWVACMLLLVVTVIMIALINLATRVGEMTTCGSLDECIRLFAAN